MTQRQSDAELALTRELKALQESYRDNWFESALPEGWRGLDAAAPIEPPKTRVTIRLDSDMVRAFRKLGPGYGARINHILRVYWLAVAAGKVSTHWEEDSHLPRFADYMAQKIALAREDSAQGRAALNTPL